jgi:hypothetical protein
LQLLCRAAFLVWTPNLQHAFGDQLPLRFKHASARPWW